MRPLSFKLLVTNPIRFGFMHFMSLFVKGSKWRKKIEDSGLFDSEYYKVQVSGGESMSESELLYHYLRKGWKVGYDPSEAFCTDAYCDQFYWHNNFSYSPLEHYLFWGYRHACSPIPASFYRDIVHGQALDEWANWAKRQERPILLISHEFSNTGAPIALLGMAESMKKIGLTPLIVSLTKGNLQGEITRRGIDNIVVGLFPSPYRRNYKEERLRVKHFMEAFDFVVFNCIIGLCWAADLPKIDKPSLCWIHDGPVAMKNVFITSRLVESISRMSLVYAVSQFTIDVFAPHCDKSVLFQLFPYGIPDIGGHIESEGNSTSDEEHNVVRFLMPGQISKRKGHHILLEAMNRLPADYLQRSRIIIAGPKSMSEMDLYDKVVNWAGSCDNIEYRGELSHDLFVKLYDEADVVLCPSLEDPLPIVCAESLSKGKAIIVSDHTGTAGLIDDKKNGFIVKAGDIDSLTDAICYAIDHPREMKEVGKRGRKVFEDVFNEDAFDRRVAQMVEAAYKLEQKTM